MLVRDDFPGKGLLDALIDLPFALPTIVTSLVMLAVYGKNSPVRHSSAAHAPGGGGGLAFVTLPMVVRAVQPVLLEIDRDVEEAAASLGASGPKVLTRSCCRRCYPRCYPEPGLAFSRCVAEFGSVVTIGGRCRARPKSRRSGSAP